MSRQRTLEKGCDTARQDAHKDAALVEPFEECCRLGLALLHGVDFLKHCDLLLLLRHMVEVMSPREVNLMCCYLGIGQPNEGA